MSKTAVYAFLSFGGPEVDRAGRRSQRGGNGQGRGRAKKQRREPRYKGTRERVSVPRVASVH
jgi:hypothetical protein